MKRILFLTQGDIQTPSSRHRVLQYLPSLKKAGYEAHLHPAVTAEEYQQAYISRSHQGNLRRLFRTFTRRVKDLHRLREFDYVFVQKPILPAPLFNMELRIAREVKMIFDFDDAIFLPKLGGAPLANLWPQGRRIASICRKAHQVVVGNHHLADFALKCRATPVVIPTVVDTDAFAQASNFTKRRQKIPVIGWVGSPSTQADLDLVVGALIDLHSRVPFVVRLVGGVASTMPVRFPIEWKTWQLEHEASVIAHLDYGIAPMKDTPWARGKCGLKILQYWAAGVPVVASPVGVYKEMIQNGENGLLASTPAEWADHLLSLMKNPELRQKIIANGRKTVLEKFSLRAMTPKFLALFEDEKPRLNQAPERFNV